MASSRLAALVAGRGSGRNPYIQAQVQQSQGGYASTSVQNVETLTQEQVATLAQMSAHASGQKYGRKDSSVADQLKAEGWQDINGVWTRVR